MSFSNYTSDNFCVGRKHRSATVKIYGDLTSEGKVLIGLNSICNRKKSMNVSDNTIKAEVLGDFFRNLGKKGLMYQKRWRKTY